jgi:hypothetical protein
MPITEFLDGYQPDPETKRVMGIAFEMARAALRLADRNDPLNEIIARRIIALAKAGERDPDRLCNGTMNGAPVLALAPAGLVISRSPSIVCPICEIPADGLDAGYFHGTAVRCLTHGEFEFSRSAEARTRTRDDWETALKRAQHRTNGDTRPRIYVTDF